MKKISKEEIEKTKKEIESTKKAKEAEVKNETMKGVGQVRNRLLSDDWSPNESIPEVHWKDIPKKKKVSLIGGWIFVIVAIIYVVITAYSPVWWGNDCLLTRIFSTEKYATTGIWIVDYAKPIFGTAYYLLAILGLSSLVRGIMTFLTRRSSKKTITLVKLTSSAIKYTAAIILIFVILGVWGVDTGTILASAGIITLVIGLGAQSLIADILGGLSIVFENQFEVGDTVVIDDFRGVVREIGLSTTKLSDAAGNMKIIKNSQVTSVINLSNELSIAVCDISVDYDQNLDTVRELLQSSLPSLKAKIPTLRSKPQYLGVNSFGDSGINIRIIAKCKEEDKFAATRALNEGVYKIMKDGNIDIPFNQLVLSYRDANKSKPIK
jgi:small conductance mechanosensitive channel